MNFIRLFMNDGSYYCIDAADWHEIVSKCINPATNEEWICLKFAASDNTLWIRIAEIQSFYMSTYSHRAECRDWEEQINNEDDEKEPWKL